MSNYRKDYLQRFSEVFKALSNPHRLQIFLRLVACCEPGTKCSVDQGQEEICAGEIGQDIDIAPSTLSHHLKELRQVGLIKMERRGKRVACWVDPGILHNLAAFFTCTKDI